MTAPAASTRRAPVPRGIAATGPALLSYGFRPFFLVAGIEAILAMLLWIAALTLGWPVGGDYGALNWHAHEMLFGYATAALGGFTLTAVPNWTGRLPVAGRPLLALLAVWLLGRIAMLVPSLVGLPVAAFCDALFLPLLSLIVAREIIAGRNWKNLRVLAGLAALAAVNIWFHLSVLLAGGAMEASRAAIAIYIFLVSLVGGRIIPSFTRNLLSRRGATGLPASFGRFDMAAVATLTLALALWSAAPEGVATAGLALLAAGLNLVRLARWRGWAVLDEPLILSLHLGYLCIPVGLVAVAVASLGAAAPASALHVLTVGVIGLMTLAVMTRASRGHTGRPLSASPATTLSYLALLLAAVLRPFAEVLPQHYHVLLALSATAWLVAFGLFLTEYAPMLLSARR